MNKNTQHVLLYIFFIFFNRTIHVIKYLHAGNGNWTESSDRCDHNCQNRHCLRSKACVTMELSAGCIGNKWSHYGSGEAEAAGEHLRTPTAPPFPEGECVCFYDQDRQLERISDFS